MWIRTASERDLEAVQQLLVETWHHTYDHIYGVDRVVEITSEWHSVPVLRKRLSQPQSEFVLADTGQELLGMAFASTTDGKVVNLHQLYILPAAQGRGAGRALLTEIEQCFPQASHVRLEVEAANTNAIGFYQAHGFKQVGETNNCGQPDSGIAALVYEKTI